VCTFIFAWQVFETAPIVIAANRDERLDRAARPPRVLDTDPQVIAPQDTEASGTWIGHNEFGLFASVTNRWTDAELAGERSRGLLVREALSYPSVDAAVAFVETQVTVDEYEGFHLVAIDTDRAVLCAWDGALTITEFDPGIHIVVNVGADTSFAIPDSAAEAGRDQATRTERALSVLQPDAGETANRWCDRAKRALRDHDYGFCVHGKGFGTRSSSLLTLAADGGIDHRFADGPPCKTAYEPVSP
jgi:uncharacterized protein with NRDE domain